MNINCDFANNLKIKRNEIEQFNIINLSDFSSCLQI